MGQRISSSITTTIVINTALSASVDFRGCASGILYMPAAWTAAGVAFQVSNDNDTFVPLEDAAGALIELVAAVDLAYALPAALTGAAYFKVWSETAGSGVNQVAARIIGLDLKT